MLKAITCFFTLCAMLLICGCGSSDSANGTGPVSNVTVALTDAQDVTRVFVFHQESDGLWDIIFDQSYNTPQSEIDFPLAVVDGDHYRIEADTLDPSTNTVRLSFQDFVANSGNITYVEPNFRLKANPPGSVVIDVPTMHPMKQPITPVTHS